MCIDQDARDTNMLEILQIVTVKRIFSSKYKSLFQLITSIIQTHTRHQKKVVT